VAAVALVGVILFPLATNVDARIGFLNTYAGLWNKAFGPRIAMVGDSIIRSNGLWFLALRTDPLAVVNNAHGGFTTEQITSVARSTARLRPQTVFYMSGTNDVGLDNDPDEAALAFQENLTTLSATGAKVIVTLAPPTSDKERNAKTAALNSRFLPIAQAQGAIVIDLWPDLAHGGVIRPEYTTDGIHLSDAAEGVWHKKLRAAL
jgi:lysophospholipase L1-like esterase